MRDLRTPAGAISPGTGPGPEVPGEWGPLPVLMIGTFTIVLDVFILTVALPSTQSCLHASAASAASASQVEWVSRFGDRSSPSPPVVSHPVASSNSVAGSGVYVTTKVCRLQAIW
ncbi:MAG: hypothetical protein ACYCVN_06080 [Acidimicrobiales bacterium]